MKKTSFILTAFILSFSAIYAQSPIRGFAMTPSTKSSTDSIASSPKIALENWRFTYPFRFAIGWENINPKNDSKGVHLLFELVSMSYSFRSLRGTGFGTALFEIPESELSSFLPVYAYYPIYTSAPKKLHSKYNDVRSPFIYLFAGGSKWGSGKDYFHPGSGQDYFHFGINAVFLTVGFEDEDIADLGKDKGSSDAIGMLSTSLLQLFLATFPLTNLSVQSGIILAAEDADTDKSTAFYISFQFGVGGIFD